MSGKEALGAVYLEGQPRSCSEDLLQLDGDFVKNEAIHCSEHKSNY